MDKNKIKSFAIWARKNLISAVSEKANRIGIYEDEIRQATLVQGGFKVDGIDEIFPFAKKDRDALVSQITEKGFEQVMEEVAYTWFNRFMGLRYMEVNEYLPSGVRILSSADKEKKEPDVLTKVSEIIDELELNAEEVYDLLDSGKTDDREKAYRIILVKQCNELGKIIPQMFEKITDYTELLLPDNLLENGSVIRKMVEDIEEDDWKEEVEIIGWMYQYYISEKKDEVFAALKKNVKITKENIPAATQLFTPKWIVKYMVENSLGRLWLEGHPNPELQNEWKYYLEEAEQEKEVEEELKKIREEHAKLTPLDIKVLDPCMGSGHILVYAFDVLYEIYKTAGYSEREIPRLILKNNLYGLDIDDRAAQLASFALIMKARQYNRRLFREIERENLELNLCSIQESNTIDKEAIDYFCSLNTGLDNNELKNDLEYLWKVFTDAKEYGSILEVEKVDFDALKQRLIEIEQEDNLMFGDYRAMLLEKLPIIIKQAQIMSGKYDVCVTNPPYMGNKSMSNKLQEYLKKMFKDAKNDLFSTFISRGFNYAQKSGFNVQVTMQSWMFLSTFQKFRESIIKNKEIISLLHMDNMVMGIAFGTCATVFRNKKTSGYKGSYTMVKQKNIIDSKPNSFPVYENGVSYVNSDQYTGIEGMPIAYWISENFRGIFKNNDKLGNLCELKQGLITANNDKFLRLWNEVSYEGIGFNCNNSKEAKEKAKKWFPYNKGGEYRKWYGNNEYVVNWEDDGKEIRNYTDSKGKLLSRPQNIEYFFREGITWSLISNGKFSVRYFPKGHAFDARGSSLFSSSIDIFYILAFMASKIAYEFLEFLSPTISFEVGNVSKLPLIIDKNKYDTIISISKENVEISREDWNLSETSWDFKRHPLIMANSNSLEESFSLWQLERNKAFNRIKENEIKLNNMFIDIYGLHGEIDPNVLNKEITIRTANREVDIKSFISYVVGCILGRYSINVEGIIYAGGEFENKWNLWGGKVRKIEKDDEGNIISDTWVNATFVPNFNNIVPITEDEYFEDDIVSTFINFIRIVYGNKSLEENLDFIADSIGRKVSETSRETIRRYFIKDFYKDHLKIYKSGNSGSRPIYWMFESGKNDGFKCLIYMHRYNEQTIAKVRTDYIHVLQRKYEAEIERLQLVVDSEQYTAKDRNAAKKKIDRISKQIEECREYDQVVAYLANEKVSIDLDDGVKVNYAKFQNVEIINSKDKKVKMNLLAKI